MEDLLKYVPPGIISAYVLGILFLKISAKLKWPSFINGNGHPSDSARAHAKLETLIGLSREHIDISKRTNESLQKIVNREDVDRERQSNIKEQLNRIEGLLK